MPGYVTEREDHADYLLLKKIYLLKIKSEQHKVNKVSINVQEKRKRMQSGYVKSHAKGNKKQNGAGEKEQQPSFNQVWRDFNTQDTGSNPTQSWKQLDATRHTFAPLTCRGETVNRQNKEEPAGP